MWMDLRSSGEEKEDLVMSDEFSAPSEARLCAFLMKHERNERVKRFWVG